VLVLGDDSANLRSEWVHQWGEVLASQRAVTVVHWDETGDTSYVTPDVLSEEGDGPPLTIWSASRTGADLASVIGRLDLFMPEEGAPDLVVIDLGVNDAAELVPSQLDVLHAEVQERAPEVPMVIVRQGLGAVESEVDDEFATWARSHDIPVWDAREAQSAQEWAELVDESVGSA
jgi:lysophospholipase L1-like esterase